MGIRTIAKRDLESTALKMVVQLAGMVRGYARKRARLKCLCLFEDRVRSDGKMTRRKSKVEWNDEPDVELILKHQLEIESIDAEQDDLRKIIDDATLDADARVKAHAIIAQLEAQKNQHMREMRGGIESARVALGLTENIMAKLAADGAKLSVTLKIAQDRIEAETKTRQLIKSSNEELDEIVKQYRAANPDELYVVEGVDADAAPPPEPQPEIRGDEGDEQQTAVH